MTYYQCRLCYTTYEEEKIPMIKAAEEMFCKPCAEKLHNDLSFQLHPTNIQLMDIRQDI